MNKIKNKYSYNFSPLDLPNSVQTGVKKSKISTHLCHDDIFHSLLKQLAGELQLVEVTLFSVSGKTVVHLKMPKVKTDTHCIPRNILNLLNVLIDMATP